MQIQEPKPGYKIVKSLFGKYEEIPEDWDYLKLKNLFKLTKGRVPSSINDTLQEGWIPYLTVDYLDRGIALFTNDENVVKIEESDVIMIGDGSGSGRVYMGKSGALSSTFILFKNDNPKIQNQFFYYFLKSKNMVFENTKFGTSIPHVDKNILYELSIPHPVMEEQQKISSNLFNIDSLIERTQKIIEQTQKLKKGLMQKLLTKGIGHTKFRKIRTLPSYFEVTIPEDWNVGKLKDLLILLKDGTHAPPIRIDNGIPLLGAENIYGGIIDFDKSLSYISKEEYDKIHKNYEIKQDDLLLTIIGASIGRVSKVPEIIRKFTLQRSVAILRTNHEMISDYLFYFMSTTYFQKQLSVRANSTAQAGVYLGEIGSIPIFYSNSKEEQQKIALILSNIDYQIKSKQEYKSNLEILKKGLMKTLLTGQIRVKV